MATSETAFRPRLISIWWEVSRRWRNPFVQLLVRSGAADILIPSCLRQPSSNGYSLFMIRWKKGGANMSNPFDLHDKNSYLGKFIAIPMPCLRLQRVRCECKGKMTTIRRQEGLRAG